MAKKCIKMFGEEVYNYDWFATKEDLESKVSSQDGKDLFSGDYEDLKNKPAIDTSAMENSSNLITSGAVYEAVSKGGSVRDIKVNEESVLDENKEALLYKADVDALCERLLGQSGTSKQTGFKTDDIDDPDETKVPTIKATQSLGRVKTLNGEEPDADGNIVIKVLDTMSGENYCTSGIQGSNVDVASVVLGSDWRMPTKAEWEELFANCTIGSIAGVNKIISKTTENSLTINPDTKGFWLADNMSDDKAYFTNGITEALLTERYKGLNIRAVTTNETYGVDMGTSVRWSSKYLGAADEKAEGFSFAFGEIAPKSVYEWDSYMCKQEDCGTDKDPLYGGTNDSVNHVTHGEAHLTNEERRFIYDAINKGGNIGIERVYWADDTHTRLVMKLK